MLWNKLTIFRYLATFKITVYYWWLVLNSLRPRHNTIYVYTIDKCYGPHVHVLHVSFPQNPQREPGWFVNVVNVMKNFSCHLFVNLLVLSSEQLLNIHRLLTVVRVWRRNIPRKCPVYLLKKGLRTGYG